MTDHRKLVRVALGLTCVAAVMLPLALRQARAVGASAAFPLSVSADGHRLIDASGREQLLVADAFWEMATATAAADLDGYLTKRQAQGFNAVEIQLIDRYYSPRSPANLAGDQPFTTPGDFATPNPAYWAYVDTVLGKVRDAGMVAIVNPDYYGWGPDGWWPEMTTNGAVKMRAYGQWVATRYLGFANLVWAHGVDRCPGDKTLIGAVPNGIRDVLPNAIQTWQNDRGLTAGGCGVRGEPWFNLDNTYTTTDVGLPTLTAFQQNPPKPVLHIEGAYEGDGSSLAQIRAQAYSAILNGATGHVYGNSTVWCGCAGWQAAVSSPGAVQVGIAGTLLSSIPSLVPSPALITAGLGSGDARASVAANAAGTVALYVPTNRSVTVNLPAGTLTKYEPTTGASVSVSVVAAGVQTLTAPAGGDWFAVLRPGAPPPTTVGGTGPTTLAPTTLAPTTLAPTTLAPSTTAATAPPTTPAVTTATTTAPMTCRQVVQVKNSAGNWVTRYIDQPASFCAASHT